MDYEENHQGSWVGTAVGIFVILLLIGLFTRDQKYEGQTAEEWYNEYADTEYQLEQVKSEKDDLESCIESHTSYYSFDDYEDLQDKLDDIKRCI